MNVAAWFYPGDLAGLLSVDGVGIIHGTDNQAAADAFVDFMLSQTAEQLSVPGLDIQQLAELDDTRDLLRDVGIIG